MLFKLGETVVGMAVLIFLLIGGYFAYRYWGVSVVRHSPLGASFQFVPPVRCGGAAANFEEFDQSDTYVANGMIREDIIGTGKYAHGTMHLVFDTQKNLYIWDEGDTRGTFIPHTINSDARSASIHDQNYSSSFVNVENCSPWWNVDDSLFIPPDYVDFQTVR